MAARKEIIIICADCGEMAVARSRKRLYCADCAAKRALKTYNSDEEELHFCDSPERINQCLNCQKPVCTNCFEGRGKDQDAPRKERGVELNAVKEEVVAAIKQGKKNVEIAKQFDVNANSVTRWKRQLRKEGLL